MRYVLTVLLAGILIAVGTVSGQGDDAIIPNWAGLWQGDGALQQRQRRRPQQALRVRRRGQADGRPNGAGRQRAFLVQPVPGRQAQVIAIPRRRFSSQQSLGVFVQADRSMVRLLKKSKEHVAEGRFQEAMTLAQHVLELEEDSFFRVDVRRPQEGEATKPEPAEVPDEEAGNKSQPPQQPAEAGATDQPVTVYRSLKTTAEQLIGQLPAPGKKAYRLKFGPVAQQLLDKSVRSGDWHSLATVSRRYFHTPAGFTATYHLGLHWLDQGDALSAAVCFDRLRKLPEARKRWEPALSLRTAMCWYRAGLLDNAQQVLDDLARSQGVKPIRLADRFVRLPASEDSAAWLASHFGRTGQTRPFNTPNQWAMFGGGPERQGVAHSMPSENVSWSADSLIFPWHRPERTRENESDVRLLQQALAASGREQESDGAASISKLTPIVVRGQVWARSPVGNVNAFDLKTGELVGATLDDDSIRKTVKSNGQNKTTQLANLLAERLWVDGASGTLSSEGQRLYAVEDVGKSALVAASTIRGGFYPRSYNTLTAYDLMTSRIAWQIGGPQHDVRPFSETNFLGPPLPLDGRLYCLTDNGSELRLVVLKQSERDGSQVEVLWSQPIYTLNIRAMTRRRRLTGISPSFSDGILICPTGTGAVVAVDLTKRSLLWGYRSDQSPMAHVRTLPGGRRIVIRNGRNLSSVSQRGWVDCQAVISDGKVLLTPQLSDSLHCLDLLDGSLAWKQPRQDGLYLAGVVDRRAVLVGSKQVWALSLKDGTVAWNPVPIPAPSGRGVIVDRRLYVPLSTSELAVVDVTSGQLLEQVKSPTGGVLGNLVYANGRFVSQTPAAIDVFTLPSAEKKEVAGR